MSSTIVYETNTTRMEHQNAIQYDRGCDLRCSQGAVERGKRIRAFEKCGPTAYQGSDLPSLEDLADPETIGDEALGRHPKRVCGEGEQ